MDETLTVGAEVIGGVGAFVVGSTVGEPVVGMVGVAVGLRVETGGSVGEAEELELVVGLEVDSPGGGARAKGGGGAEPSVAVMVPYVPNAGEEDKLLARAGRLAANASAASAESNVTVVSTCTLPSATEVITTASVDT